MVPYSIHAAWRLLTSIARFERLKYLRICIDQREPYSFDAHSRWMHDLLKSISISKNISYYKLALGILP